LTEGHFEQRENSPKQIVFCDSNIEIKTVYYSENYFFHIKSDLKCQLIFSDSERKNGSGIEEVIRKCHSEPEGAENLSRTGLSVFSRAVLLYDREPASSPLLYHYLFCLL